MKIFLSIYLVALKRAALAAQTLHDQELGPKKMLEVSTF